MKTVERSDMSRPGGIKARNSFAQGLPTKKKIWFEDRPRLSSKDYMDKISVSGLGETKSSQPLPLKKRHSDK